jgi:hypothetical protein
MQKATVYSVYMANVSPEVAEAQRRVVHQFLPKGWAFVQRRADGYSHPTELTVCQASNTNALTVFLDIDCIPLSRSAFELIGEQAERGVLAGAVQRANHIENNEHIYVGPCCMAFNNRRYLEYGSPCFFETPRGDVGEEVTYRWQERGGDIYLLWPSRVNSPLWNLNTGSDKRLGLGTTYDELFYHEFCARAQAGDFVRKCKEVIKSTMEAVS